MRRSTSEIRKASMGSPKSFMDYVQHHERTWGTENYTNRPDLGTIIGSPVVVFWDAGDDEGRYKITLHSDLSDVEKHLLRMLIGARKEAPKQRIVEIFQNQKRMVISGVKITLKEADD